MKDGETLFSSTRSDGHPLPEWFAYEGDEKVENESSRLDSDFQRSSDDIPVENSDQEIRSKLVDRVMQVLRGDAERMDGRLHGEDVQRQCFRRDLTIAECMRVEVLLSDDGISILSDDDAEDADTDGAPAAKSHSSPSEKTLFLTDVEERELGRKIQLALRLSVDPSQLSNEYMQRLQKEAIAAKARFVESNLRYVKKVAARYANTRHMTEEDIFQEGVIGLLRATDSYDPEMGFRFKTYATWWITQKILRAIADFDRTIRLPVHVNEKVRAAKRASRTLMATSGVEPSLNEIAQVVGIETERLAQIMWAVKESECVDGDAPVSEDIDDGGTTLFSLLKDSQTVSQFDLAFRKQLELLIRDNLTAKQAEVLLQRFGFEESGEKTLEEVGGRLGRTRERVRQIQNRALSKLRRILEGTIYRKPTKNNGIIRSRD